MFSVARAVDEETDSPFDCLKSQSQSVAGSTPSRLTFVLHHAGQGARRRASLVALGCPPRLKPKADIRGPFKNVHRLSRQTHAVKSSSQSRPPCCKL